MKNKVKILTLLAAIILTGCAGGQVGDEIVTETQVCTTTWEYKWVWSFIDTGFKKVPVTSCIDK